MHSQCQLVSAGGDAKWIQQELLKTIVLRQNEACPPPRAASRREADTLTKKFLREGRSALLKNTTAISQAHGYT